MAGASGAGPIQGFDTTGFSVTLAAEVKNFDPLNFVDKKESRKMGRCKKNEFHDSASHQSSEQSFWTPLGPGRVKAVPDGDQEIAWLAPATSGENWGMK